MPRLTNQPASKNFVDLTAINPYLDQLFRILLSPSTSRQSTDNHPNGKFPILNPGLDDPHELLKDDAQLTKKHIMNWLVNDYLMKAHMQSQPKGEPPYGGLADGTSPSR